MRGEEEAVLETVGVLECVIVEVVVFVEVDEGEGREEGHTERDTVIVFVAVLLAVLVALLATSRRSPVRETFTSMALCAICKGCISSEGGEDFAETRKRVRQ